MNNSKCLFPNIYLLLGLILLVSSCDRLVMNQLRKNMELKATYHLKGQIDSNLTFTGLEKMTDAGSNKVTNILLIHGVRKTQKDHFKPLTDNLLVSLGYDTVSCRKESIKVGSADKLARQGIVTISEYRNNGDTIRIYDILWSQITEPAKNLITDLDENKDRTTFAQFVKQNYLIDVFADIALYVGPYRDTIFETIDEALNRMGRTDPFNPSSPKADNPGEIAMITGSFGSKIIFDFLVEKLQAKVQNLVVEELDDIQVQLKNQIKPGTGEKEFSDAVTRFLSGRIAAVAGKNKAYRKKMESKNILRANHSVADSSLLKLYNDLKDSLLYPGNPYTDYHERISACVSTCTDEVYKQNVIYLAIAQNLKKIFMLSNQLPFVANIDLLPQDTFSRDQFIDNIYQNIDGLFDFVKNSPAYKDQDYATEKIDIISFYDPNDVFGYRLPTPRSSKSVQVINVELYNEIQWSYNPIAVRNFVGGTNNPAVKQFASNVLRQDTMRQTLNFAIQAPNAAAKNNPILTKYIVEGTDYTTAVDTFNFYGNKKKGKKKTKVDEETGLVKVKKDPFKFIKNLGRKIVLSPYRKAFKKVDMKPAWLPYEFPADTIQFEGLEKGIRQHDTVNVLTIHGIRSKPPEHFDLMVDGIVQKLKFNARPHRDSVINLEPSNGKNQLANSTQIRVLEFINYEDQVLRFFIVYWSPMTFRVKELLNEVDNENDMANKRSFIPRTLKNELINNAMADVTLMINNYKPELDRTLDTAFQLMLLKDPFLPARPNNKNTGTDKSNYFISGSLGSKLLFDYLVSCLDTADINNNHRNNTAPATVNIHRAPNAKLLLQQLNTYFMLTNQLSLVSLKDLDPGIKSDNSEKLVIDHIYQNWDDISLPQDSLDIVAFGDPNDILSFILPPPNESKINVNNVRLNIANGTEVDVYGLYKLLKKVDGLVDQLPIMRLRFKLWQDSRKAEEKAGDRKDLRESYRNQIKALKKSFTKKRESLTDRLGPMLSRDNPKQTFVFRFDIAHSGPSEDDRIIEMLTFGTNNIKRVDDKIERTKYENPKRN